MIHSCNEGFEVFARSLYAEIEVAMGQTLGAPKIEWFPSGEVRGKRSNELNMPCLMQRS